MPEDLRPDLPGDMLSYLLSYLPGHLPADMFCHLRPRLCSNSSCGPTEFKRSPDGQVIYKGPVSSGTELNKVL